MEKSPPKVKLSKRETQLVLDKDAELDLTGFVLSPNAQVALENLRVSYIKDKVETNALTYINNPEEYVKSQMRNDIALEILTYLLEVHTTNLPQEK